MRRRQGNYFKPLPEAPPPLTTTVRHRASFSEVDAMAVAWHGRYPRFFEMAHEALCRRIGLSYKDFFEAGLQAPVVQLHTDYHRSIRLDEEVVITVKLVWTEAARLNAEYSIVKEDGQLAATGFTVQMFTDGISGEPYLTIPDLLERCRTRWRRGDLREMQ